MSKKGNSKHSNGVHKRLYIGVLIVLALMLGSFPPMVSAQAQANKVKVLIAFSHQPGSAEQALIHSYGGDIKYNYHLVPAIAASMPEKAISALEKNPVIIRVDPDVEVHVLDAELDNTWGVKHIGTGLVHAGGMKGAGVKVGILDTGIDLDHPDLNYDPTCSANFVEGENLDDGNSHGTHVAGTLAALDNSIGVVGVAPEVTLCIYKVFDSSGNGNYSDIIAAIQQAVDDSVQITNNSYGSLSDPGATVKAAFDNAYAAGILQVGAAGNYGNIFGTGENCIYPARWDSVMAVAATMQDDTRASFSSTCPEAELAAPGYQINSTMPGGGFGEKNGTSMASPHVAGVATLVWAANPGWNNNNVRFQLQNTSDDLGDPGRDSWYGYGLVDADEAAGFSNNPPVADNQSVMTAEDTPASITLTGNDPDGDALNFSVVSVPSNGVLSGTAPNLTYTPNLNFNGPDSFTFKINDGTTDGSIATVSLTVSPVNDPPLANAQAVTATAGTPRAITLSGSDPDEDALTFSVISAPSHGTLSGTVPNLTYTPNATYNGPDSFTFRVNDGTVNSILATVSITVTDKITIIKANYTSRKQKLDVEATSSAGSGVTLTATAFDVAGNVLGSVQMSYNAKRGVYVGTITGLASKPFRVVVTSSKGGSASSIQGAGIGG